MSNRILHYLRPILYRGNGRWLWLSAGVGILCGLLGFVFVIASDAGAHLFLGLIAGYHPAQPAGEGHLFSVVAETDLRWWWLLLIIPGGGLLSGLLTHHLAPRASGSGTEAAVDAYHNDEGRMPGRNTIVKFFASVAVLSTGGSAGREGPITMMGAGLGGWFAKHLHLSRHDRRILLAAGMAGGIAAVFRTPLAAALFALEVVYKDSEVESDTMIPCFIASIVSFCSFGLFSGLVFHTAHSHTDMVSQLFYTETIPFTAADVSHLGGYLVLAVAILFASRLFVAILHRGEHGFARLTPRPWLRPAIGGLCTAVIGLAVLAIATRSGLDAVEGMNPLAAIGSGYGIIQTLLRGLTMDPEHSGIALRLLLLLLLVGIGKMVTTACTVTSGGSGGIFGPSIVIGGCLGAAVGLFLWLIPGADALGLVPPISACAIMGIAGFLTASHKIPITAILMVSELTGNYWLLLPAMWVCAIAFLFGGRESIVGTQLINSLESPAHRGRLFQGLTGGITVAEVIDLDAPVISLRDDLDREACRQHIADSDDGQRTQTHFPVVDANEQLIGLLHAADLDAMATTAADLADGDCLTITLEDSLAEALTRFAQTHADVLPVVSGADDRRLFGLLERNAFIRFYGKTIAHLHRQRQSPADRISGGHPYMQSPDQT